MAIIAEALATEVLAPEEVARQRLVNLVKQIQVNIEYYQTVKPHSRMCPENKIHLLQNSNLNWGLFAKFKTIFETFLGSLGSKGYL